MEHVNIAIGKMSISEVHCKLGHISHNVIKMQSPAEGLPVLTLTWFQKSEFCEPCVKAKSARQPFPKQSDTRATNYGEQVHWDLWGPTSVKGLNGNLYVVAHIDDHTHKGQLYFQPNKVETFKFYKMDEALIETHSGNQIKFSHTN